MDLDADPHPAISGLSDLQYQSYSFISNAEMKRINIEISFNIYRLVQISRERGYDGLATLLWKACDSLPMPFRKQRQNRDMTNDLFASLVAGSQIVPDLEEAHVDRRILGFRQIAPEDADRFIANLLACNHWRNTIIEDVHAGRIPPQGLKPHGQRFTRQGQQAVLREVTANLGSVLFAMNMLFDEEYRLDTCVAWPKTATALANSFYNNCGSEWSLTATSSSISLHKSV
ncbi:hypothetical protein [Aggregatilinea lenta]|uniref:hypothetical protein n=1 Tax=Aggregatilinea lenta TaxID=913108 RepID=UPI0013C36B17|nr:hypothetical protein [Aggregatilinea lenta]